MASETGFSLISVNSDDDDVVIQAGARSADGNTEAEEAPEREEEPEGLQVEDARDDDVKTPEDEGDDTNEDLEGDDDAPVLSPEALRLQQELEDAGLRVSDLDDEARAEFAEHVRVRQQRAAEQMITTEDDLHTKMPFSGMQRAIVILLLLLVVAFVVYWFVGR